ncbi:hypothetical protein L218DRAFT_991872 [Marasmius fiardii PR-910]|nr:hypothetical protein L218DRAFT_991872 [Marasmius fiardii PR-910]
MRAYYRSPLRDPSNDDLLQPLNSGRLVEEEKLGAFGFKTFTLEGKTEKEILESFRQVAKDVPEFDGQEYFFDYRKETISGIPTLPEMSSKKALEYFSTVSLNSLDILALCQVWEGFFDFKEPGTEEYIRIALRAKDMFSFPRGTIFEIHASSNSSVCVKYKTTLPSDEKLYVKGGNLESQPLRRAYLESINAV